MRFRFMMAACVAAVLSLPLVAQEQGIVRGAEEGATAGNRAAGPVGGAVGAGVGGIVGGVEGVLGIPRRHGSSYVRDRADLTPEQEKNWPGFETTMSDMGKRYGDRQTAMQATVHSRKLPSTLSNNCATRLSS